MPPTPRPLSDRSAEALRLLERQGGIMALPEVLTSHDVIPLFGRDFFMEMLRRGKLPGVQVVNGGVWRCYRETFCLWLKESANASH